MNPYEHGECYVTEDGAETDLDLGHYERFLDTPTSQANNITCLLYTSDAADERSSVDLGGRRIIKKQNTTHSDYTDSF